MKAGIIDIGSNSVRLAMLADGKTLYKRISTTRLGEGIACGSMKAEAIERTARAVAAFVAQSKDEGAEKVYAFATAAVRSAANRDEFTSLVKSLCAIEVDVISGEEEALTGLLGALKGGDGGIIDVGGASTEVSVNKGGKTLYSKSVDVGAVRLYDLAGRDKIKLEKVISERIEEYGDFSAADFEMYAIGGTATTIASVKHGLKVYDPAVTDGTRVTLDEMNAMADKLLSLSVDEVRRVAGMEPRRADVVGGGCLLMSMIMKKFGIASITVSESDNIEGYYMLREGVR